jgi:flagellar motor switch protein FliM
MCLRNLAASCDARVRISELGLCDMSVSRIATVRFTAADDLAGVAGAAYRLSSRAPAFEFIVVLEAELVAVLVDRLVGGDGKSRQLVPRPVSMVDHSLAGILVAELAQGIAAAFNPIIASIEGFGWSDGQSFREALQRSEEWVVLVTIGARINECRHQFNVVFPIAQLQLLRECSVESASLKPTQAEWTDSVRQHVASTMVQLAAALPDIHCNLAELAGLRVGATLPLGVTKDDPIHMRAEEEVVFIGRLGRNGRNLSIKVDVTPNNVATTGSTQA